MSIRFPLLTLTLLAASLGATLPASAQTLKEIPYTPKGWKLPEAQAQKWVTRFRSILPDGDWKVKVDGNNIIIEREKPVRFAQIEPLTSSSIRKPTVYREGTYRLTLGFGPVMGLDKYEELKAKNQAVNLEKEKLRSKYSLGVPGIIRPSPFDPDVLKDVPPALREEMKKLVLKQLPEAFTPENSVRISQSWEKNEAPNNLDIAINQECNYVHQKVMSFFGFYERDANIYRLLPEPIYGLFRAF